MTPQDWTHRCAALSPVSVLKKRRRANAGSPAMSGQDRLQRALLQLSEGGCPASTAWGWGCLLENRYLIFSSAACLTKKSRPLCPEEMGHPSRKWRLAASVWWGKGTASIFILPPCSLQCWACLFAKWAHTHLWAKDITFTMRHYK